MITKGMVLEQKYFLEEKNQDPFQIFSNWYKAAVNNEINDPNAMNVATVSANMQPTSRMIFLKEYDESGFIFNTNNESKKLNDIKSNNLVALNFHWKSLRRQIRIEGKVSALNNKKSDEYFKNSPRELQIAAWSSKQSELLPNRKLLNKRVCYYEDLFNNITIPRPVFWSTFKVLPTYFEFWWDVKLRLHYRIAFKKNRREWVKYMLYP